MGSKRSQATDDKLLALLEIAETANESGEKVILLEDDLFSFLQTFNIQEGNELVLKSVMYDLYKNWSNYPMKRQIFSLKLARYLQEHRKGRNYYFKTNRNSFSLNTELLKYLEKKRINKTKYIKWKNHFELFLKYFNLAPGKGWVKSSVFKFLYDKWCYSSKKRPLLSDAQLFNFLKLYFKHKRNAKSSMQWFGVSEEFAKKYSSSELYLTPIQHRKKSNEKKQKTTRKIPGTTP